MEAALLRRPVRAVPIAEPQPPATAFRVHWARNHEDVRAAQRLRYRVFVGELGARLTIPPGAPAEHDVDRYDDHCEHLIVRTLPRHGGDGEVIGTYHVLLPAAARRAGGYYSESEFDLAPLAPLRAGMVELGRSCVHPDWRAGGVILALWGALGELMRRYRMTAMVGCASVGMHDGGHYAARVCRSLSERHLADAAWRVWPHRPLPLAELRDDLRVEPPPLVKGYIRCGARLLGPPAWDPEFNTADLPLLMRIEDLPDRYRRHFVEG